MDKARTKRRATRANRHGRWPQDLLVLRRVSASPRVTRVRERGHLPPYLLNETHASFSSVRLLQCSPNQLHHVQLRSRRPNWSN